MKVLRLTALVALSLVLIVTSAFALEYANPQLLVAPDDIEKNMDKWIVIDCRDSKAYEKGHIPKAIHFGDACPKVLRDATSRVKKTEDLEKLLGEAGVSGDKTVVVYADAKHITDATVAFWILEYLGVKDVRFLNGGIEAWTKSGRALETSPTKLPPTTFKAKVVKSRIATTEEMVDIAKERLKV